MSLERSSLALNIKVTLKKIKEMCGTVSFKKGDNFHRANKVILEEVQADRYTATVKGIEDFHVTVEVGVNGAILTKCSCPKLASFHKDCQHIAAVLLAIYEHEQQESASNLINDSSDFAQNQCLADEFLNLFQEQKQISTKQQTYFEKRQVLDVEFVLKPLNIGNDQYMFSVELKVGGGTVNHLREFFEGIKERKPFTPIYDPSIHCFEKNTDELLKDLTKLIKNEKINNKKPIRSSDRTEQFIVIPPTSWEQTLNLLVKAPLVSFQDSSNVYDGLQVVNERPFLQFELVSGDSEGYHLKVTGHDNLIIMKEYNFVVNDGLLGRIDHDDCKRLSDLKQMIATSNSDKIPISKQQIHFFLEKIVPGLKKLGAVQINAAISDELAKKAPLKARLYLDRVNNRLLAALEFHYENIIINPLDPTQVKDGQVVFRDEEKEEYILQQIEKSGFATTDSGFYLHNEELEYEFLYHVIPHIEKLIQIYATTSVKLRIFKASAPPQIRVKLKKDRMNWLEFKFEMDGIPEQQIRDILQAIEEKRKYYRLPTGAFLPLETREFQDVKHFLNEVPNQHLELEKGLNMPLVQGLQHLDTVQGSIFSEEKSFRDFVRHLKNPGDLYFPVPSRLMNVLRNYQKQGYQWLKTLANYGFGGILADDMGLGKTLQSITYIVSELETIRERKRPILIVCPSSLTYNWISELKKFAPEVQAMIVDGDLKDRHFKLKQTAVVDIVIASYPLIRKDIHLYEKLTFHTVFFDEAQAFKNPGTQIARTVKKIKADHRFALTGTPVENSLVELWSIFHVVFPELFKGLKEYSHLTNKAISRRVSLFLLRRVKEDVLSELPEKIETIDRVELLPDQKKLYAAYLAKLRHETLKHLDKETIKKNRIKILAGLTRLRQICCHPGLFVDGYKGRSAKFQQLLEILEEANLSGRRVLIFSQFTKMLELIGKQLTADGKSFFYLDGQTPSKERLEICDRFNHGERDIFLISLKAGGTGLNLTGADTVILYDLWWNPAVEEQAADRAYRIGQKNSVQVIKLVTQGTIEEKINELQAKKRDLIEEIIEPTESRTSSLTEEDIREIFS